MKVMIVKELMTGDVSPVAMFYTHNLPQKKVVGVDGKSRRRLKEKFWFEKSVNDRCDFRSDPSENKNLRRTNFSRGLSFGLGP